MRDTGLRDLYGRKPEFFSINSSDADVVLVENSDNNKQIVLTHLLLAASGAGTVIFFSNIDDKGRVTFKTNDPPLVLPRTADGWIQCGFGQKLHLNNASTLTLTGFGSYFLL